MKDLVVRKPSLAELTGISDSRLNCFASNLRAYLAGSVVTSSQTIPSLSASEDLTDSSELRLPQSSFNCQKSSRVRQYGSQGSKTSLIYQGSLSPRSSSFKEGLQKSLSSIRSAAAREKLRRRGEDYVSSIDGLPLASSKTTDTSCSNLFQKDTFPEINGTHTFAALDLLDLPVSVPEIPLSGPSPFTPHYCWCPPVASALHYTNGNPKLLPISSTESFSLPPLSSLLSSSRTSSLLTSRPLLNLAEVPPLDFPGLLPEPLVRLPTSQQIPTFTPFICDPIVHIPVIDVCSSGQGYLVSAGPAMSTLSTNLVDPMLPNADSVLEKGARETLRMLISSSSSNQPNSQFLEVFPSVFSSGSNDMQNVLAAGSRGLYSGTIDVNSITSSMSTMGLVLLSEKSVGGGGGGGKRFAGRDDLIDRNQNDKSSTSALDEGID